MKSWKIIYKEWVPEQQPLRETLLALGNGYLVTRGAVEEARAGGVHYPGTYLACGYNRLKSKVFGRIIENEDLVNWPNWLYLTFRIEDSDWFDLNHVDIQSYHHELDMQKGVLSRQIQFQNKNGHITVLKSRRFVHMGQKNMAALEWEIRPENWSGTVYVRCGLDGSVVNSGVERYRPLNGKHLEILETGRAGEDGIYLHVQTNQSHIRMAQAERVQVFKNNVLLPVSRNMISEDGLVMQELVVTCDKKEAIRIEKIVSIHTSQDHAITEELSRARTMIRRAGQFDELRVQHEKAWERLWHRCNIELSKARKESQPILRLHIFHLLQTASFNSIDMDIGIPSRGWHGEAYRGHIFWDELFVFPFLNLRIPELTRELLLYRYRRLGEARSAASKSGYRGAMYPWQSGSDGREESQEIHLNPKSGKWEPDNTHLQRHVNAAIAYNICQYFESTLDIEFMSYYGVEMLLNIAQFLASLTDFNPSRERFEIHHIVGPDEFHTAYPDSDEPGLNNNAYTNIMTAFVLKNVLEKLRVLAQDRQAELMDMLDVREEDLSRWEHISKKMYVPFHDEGIISQFEGYEQLEELDWNDYRKKYGNIERLDRILRAEGDSPNRYKAGKQADVLMLFYLFSAEELKGILEQLEYDFDPQVMIPRNIHYYVKRSSFGSSLSRLVYSWVLARLDREASWKYFLEALDVDFHDIQGGTTEEGIHLGAMAGTVDMVQRCYTGIEIRDHILWINPALPEELNRIQMRIRYRGHWIRMRFDSDILCVEFEKGYSPEVKIGFREDIYVMSQGDKKVFKL
ncbi:glycoside hydrolase family 65 protein [bacterium]|nr:glycoside hydrolase family 65 protein [bacterium]